MEKKVQTLLDISRRDREKGQKWDEACLHRFTVLKEASSHKAGIQGGSPGLPPQMRGTLKPRRFMLLSAASCGIGCTGLFLMGVFSREQHSLSNAKVQGLERLVPETLSSQPSLLTALPICHQVGQPSSAVLLFLPLPTISWR